MSRLTHSTVILVCLVGLLLPLGCGDSNTPQIGRIDLVFTYKVGALPYFPESLNYFLHPGESQTLFSIDTLKYYVSRIRLSGGSNFATDEVFFMNVTNQGSAYENILSFTSVPSGNYSQISFTFGIDAEQNVAGGLPSPANDEMIWPEQIGGGGYHYMKMEGRWINDAGDTLSYLTHTGPTPNDDNADYFFTVTLPLQQFNLATGKTMRVPLLMDCIEWYNNPNSYDFPTPPMIMNDPARQAVLKENGMSTDAWTAGTPIPPDFEN